MVTILYDLKRLEMVYSIASIIMKFYRHGIKTIYTSPSTILSIIEEEVKNYQDNYYFDEEAEIDPDYAENKDLKIFILGLGPKTYEENNDLYNLIESYGENITIWVDNQAWPDNLLKYLSRKNINFFLDQNMTCLEILNEIGGYYAPKSWILAEKGIIQNSYKNNYSARYLKTFKVKTVKGVICEKKIEFQDDAIKLIYNEIINGVKSRKINNLVCEYAPLKKQTNKMLNLIENEHPAFTAAKIYGGKFGFILMGDISNLIDIAEIKKVISEKYPELWIISYKFKGKNYIQASSCIPSLFYDIESFLNDVKDINTKEFLSVMGIRYYNYLRNTKTFAALNTKVTKRSYTKTTRP